uniref:Thiaminase-2/PQQC domain-containing protein n=1 Tax=Cannabis sativa TaxID=3483 RepID=A0A803PVG8_CANSA
MQGHDYIFVRAFVPFVASLIVKAWKESDDRSDMKVRLGGMAPMNDEREWFKKEAFKWGVQLFHPLLPHKPNQEILQVQVADEMSVAVLTRDLLKERLSRASLESSELKKVKDQVQKRRQLWPT